MTQPVCFFLMVVPVVGLLGGCTNVPVAPTPVIPKFKCLSTPSAAYQAGSVIRTVAGSTSISPDELTVAWLPIDKPSFSGGFADINQETKTGLDANLTANMFAKFGVVANLSTDITYSISVKALNNTQYLTDDDIRYNTVKSVKEKNGLIPGARYFFIKEALGSQNLTYEIKNKAVVTATAELKADSSRFSANIRARDASNTVSSKRELVACVVLEEIDINVVSAADGKHSIAIKTIATMVTEDDLKSLEAVSKIE